MSITGKTILLAGILSSSLACHASSLFINEFHYDNAGFDKGEGVEIAGAAGSDLMGYELLFYNGSNGSIYESLELSGSIADQDNGFGTLFFGVSGLQNGGPDGVALVDPNGIVVQFLSYEGSFVAQSGAASGLGSTDIGVAEDGSGMPGSSLQLVGQGSVYADFVWVAADLASYNQVNVGQSFIAAVPLPAALPLFAAALGIMAMTGRRVDT